MDDFDADTAIDTTGTESLAGVITDRWSIADRPNGGYLMAMGVRALGTGLAHPDPLTVTGHFLRSPVPGPITATVESIRDGRTVSTGEARLFQNGREFLRLLGTFGDLRAAVGVTDMQVKPPGMPDLDDCIRAAPDGLMPDGTRLSIMQRLDIRMAPDAFGWLRGQPSDRAEVCAWIRFADDREPDLLSLALIVDGVAPAVLSVGHTGSVPTIELTTHFRAHPAPGWLKLVTRTRALIDGYLDEEAEIWDSEDRLVAQGRQFARLAGAGEH
jgi:acyl-CoA thioesterase